MWYIKTMNIHEIINKKAGTATEEEMQFVVENSFMRNVPELMRQGMDFDTAMKTAYEKDLVLLSQLADVAQTPKRSLYGYRAGLRELVDGMAERTYTRIRNEASE